MQFRSSEWLAGDGRVDAVVVLVLGLSLTFSVQEIPGTQIPVLSLPGPR